MERDEKHALESRGKHAVEREGTRPGPVFRPDVDILETPSGFVVTADLPGVDEGGARIHLERGVLTIDAELAERPEPGWTPLLVEYRLGGFHREFRLSDAIDTGRISATLRDGVLELHLPKAEPHRPRTIPVQAG
jgi:HSP20 family molecular chaperone IbpA